MSAGKGLEGYRRKVSEQKRASIVRAATAHFRESGFHNTAMADIAKTADVSTATLYKHAKSKEGLFAICMEEMDASPSSGTPISDFLKEVARAELAGIVLPEEKEKAHRVMEVFLTEG